MTFDMQISSSLEFRTVAYSLEPERQERKFTTAVERTTTVYVLKLPKSARVNLALLLHTHQLGESSAAVQQNRTPPTPWSS